MRMVFSSAAAPAPPAPVWVMTPDPVGLVAVRLAWSCPRLRRFMKITSGDWPFWNLVSAVLIRASVAPLPESAVSFLMRTTLSCVVICRAGYRLILRNVGGVDSCKDLTNPSFEKVMAFFEQMGFKDNRGGPGYWSNKANRQGELVNERIVFKIRALAQGQPYDIGALCRRFSNHRTDQLHQLTPGEAYALVEMLKAVHERDDAAKRKSDSSFSLQPSSLSPATGNSPTQSHGGEDDDDLPF